MSPRTKTNSGKNWVATGHWPTTCNVQNLDELCLHYGTLWCTLQLTNCSICSLWRPVKNVHNAECTFTNPKTPDIWSSAELDYHRARASSPSALGFLRPNRRLPPSSSKLHQFTAVTHSTLPAGSKSPHTSDILDRVIREKPVDQNVCFNSKWNPFAKQ